MSEGQHQELRLALKQKDQLINAMEQSHRQELEELSQKFHIQFNTELANFKKSISAERDQEISKTKEEFNKQIEEYKSAINEDLSRKDAEIQKLKESCETYRLNGINSLVALSKSVQREKLFYREYCVLLDKLETLGHIEPEVLNEFGEK